MTAHLVISWIVVLILFAIGWGIAYIQGMKKQIEMTFRCPDMWIELLLLRKSGRFTKEDMLRIVEKYRLR